MPINYKDYPDNWKTEIRPAILERSKHCCEFCNVPNYSVGTRNKERNFVPIKGNIYLDMAGEGLSYPSLQPLTYSQAKDWADGLNDDSYVREKHIVIVLTIAHLDHDTQNNDYSNLRALCQRCHNKYDVGHRKENRKKNRGILNLFDTHI